MGTAGAGMEHSMGLPGLAAVGWQRAVGQSQWLGAAVPPPPARCLPPWLWGAGTGKEGMVTLLVILQA